VDVDVTTLVPNAPDPESAGLAATNRADVRFAARD